jgi:hypothetical protein
MVAPLVGGFSALQAVMQPASNAAAKSIFVRTLMTGFYTGRRKCKEKFFHPNLFILKHRAFLAFSF